MNIILVLVSMCLLCGGIGLYVAARNAAEERREAHRRRMVESVSHTRRPAGTDLPVTWQIHGKRDIFLPLSVVLCLFSACLPATAQKVVHARAGQVIAVNPTAHTITLKASDGSTVLFKDVTSPEPHLSFDKSIRDKTVPAASFSKIGSEVVVFYFGFNDPTAVAVKELTPNATQASTGSVANFDRRAHLLTLRTATPQPQKLVLTDATVVDTPSGIIKMSDYHPDKGEQVRCLFEAKQDQTSALFVAPN